MRLRTVNVTRYIAPLREGGKRKDHSAPAGDTVMVRRGPRHQNADRRARGQSCGRGTGLCGARDGFRGARRGFRPHRGRRGDPRPAEGEPGVEPRTVFPLGCVHFRSGGGEARCPHGFADSVARRFPDQRRPHRGESRTPIC